ncbi:MAG: decarboxylating NADP(+)-dependent phosphogluconate dehydrogenase [Acidimicrobiia bacterium]|nr:MAG: decarboxylating NADP(+)-dependent phosphogluconate dehydrogenase [Acidimicrobiia bacterium]
MPADIGLIGLAVMGQNLVLNLADHGATVAVYNRTTSKVDDFLAGAAAGTSVIGVHSLEELVASLARPRRIMLMVQAGGPVDATIDALVPLLEEGDIIIDGGNSHFADSERRMHDLAERGLRFIGAGISGGEEGARYGPSIMPGGDAEAWPHLRDLFQSIAAKAKDGTPCCDWVGSGGAGHYVKMVHNGIEYGDMQVIAEAYWLMKAQGRSHAEMAGIFRAWGEGVLDSYLIDITADILDYRDEGGSPLVERILDAAGQKGTGKWTAISALDLGQPMTLVAEAVFARVVSALKDQRVRASSALPAGTDGRIPSASTDEVRDALYASKIVSYTQGFMLLRAAADEHGWDLDYGVIAGLWRAGCIIRAAFLDDITAAFEGDPDLEALLLDPFFLDAITRALPGWRAVVADAVASGLPVPAYAAALTFYDGYRSEAVPANLVQAQRDYFGAHTYERVDRPRGEWFHTDWTGEGGDATSGSYEA